MAKILIRNFSFWYGDDLLKESQKEVGDLHLKLL
jgi:hypothetical protein